MKRTLHTALGILSCLGIAVAQTGTITQGGTSYAFTTAGSACATPGYDNFTATTQDTLYQHFWSLCKDADPVSCTLYAPTSVEMGTAPGGPSVARIEYVNFQNKQLDVLWYVNVNEVTAGSAGNAVSRIRVTNTSNQAATLQLYAYFDIDFCASAANNNATGSLGTNARVHNITNASCPTEFLELYAAGADGDAAAAFATLRGQITAGCPDFTLAPFSPGGVFGPADYTGAFQWANRVVAPGQSLEARVLIGHNVSHRACGNAAAISPYGTPSGANATLTGVMTPVLGSVTELQVHGGQPSAAGAFLMDVAPTNIPIAGLTMLVIPSVTISAALDASGSGRLEFPIPYRAFFCGASSYVQYVYIDPTSTASLPISATNGVGLTIGS